MDGRQVMNNAVLQGGGDTALAVYSAQWTSNTGETATNLYARWIDASAPSEGAGGSGEGGESSAGSSNSSSSGAGGSHGGSAGSSAPGAAGEAGSTGDLGEAGLGTSGTKGSAGRGGSSGAAGKSSSAGEGGDGTDGGGASKPKDSGCGCSVPSSQPDGSLLGFGIVAGAFARRRKRSRG
jgi:MYXO-CTERM domain-containing protein